MFDKILDKNFKNLYNQAIDHLIGQKGFAVPCSLIYDSLKKGSCPNCFFDPILNRSSNRYNQTGPAPFADGSICPVCIGNGIIDMTKQEVIYLSVIFDSKYWLNWNSNSVNIADNKAQSICKIELLPKLQNCKEIIMDTSTSAYGDRRYSRINEPQICGLGQNRYIITMWEKIS